MSNFTIFFGTAFLIFSVTLGVAAAEKKDAAKKSSEKLMCVEKINGRWHFQSCELCIENKDKDCEVYDPKKHSSKLKN